jgi:murein DD-endopeptidase MepM/ murein hydrolase activator NlpD
MRDRIRASDEGIVAFAGRFRGYGMAVMIAHPGGAVTVYGHLTRSIVRPGRRVRRGQVIGVAGSTGNSTGPHLHFELRVDGRPVDPSGMFDSRPVVSGPPPGYRFGPGQADEEEAPAHGEEIDEDEGGDAEGTRSPSASPEVRYASDG